MKLKIKFSSLNNEQRKQVLSFFEERIEKRELFEHDLNKAFYSVNAKTGNIVFHKDF